MNIIRPALSLSLLALTVPISAQTALLREGDPAPGGVPGQTIFGINNTAVNQSGGFAATLSTVSGSTSISQIWGNLDGGPGALIREESSVAGFIQCSIDSSFGISANSVAYLALVDEAGGSTDLDSIWLDDTVVAVTEGMVPGTSDFFTFSNRAGVTQDGIPYFVSSTSSTAGGASQSRGLFFGTSPTAIIQTGDMLPNLPAPLSSFAVDSDFRFSSLGTRFIALVDLETGSSTNDGAMTIDGEGILIGGTLVQEATPLPTSAGGFTGENWDNFDFFGITESGDYMFTGDTDGGSTSDEIIVRNGAVWAREGDLIDGQLISGSIESAFLNENNQLGYIWDIETAAGNIEALFLDDTLVLQEGDAVDWDGDGVLDPGVVIADFTGAGFVGTNSMTVDPTGAIYFTADVDVSGSILEGYFVLAPGEVGTNFCMANINSSGVSASISSTGSAFLSSNNLVLRCVDMPQLSFGFFLVSMEQGFVGNPAGSAGNLCLAGSIGRYVGPGQIMNSDLEGSISLAIDVTALPQPTGSVSVQAGETWNFQTWFRDTVAGVSTSNFSNGLEVTFL